MRRVVVFFAVFLVVVRFVGACLVAVFVVAVFFFVEGVDCFVGVDFVTPRFTVTLRDGDGGLTFAGIRRMVGRGSLDSVGGSAGGVGGEAGGVTASGSEADTCGSGCGAGGGSGCDSAGGGRCRRWPRSSQARSSLSVWINSMRSAVALRTAML